MATGKVRVFKDEKGFGFITNDAGGPDVFCHHSSIQISGRRNLREGQRVQFDVEQGEKGLRAANVVPLD